jgi:hypothetical protein
MTQGKILLAFLAVTLIMMGDSARAASPDPVVIAGNEAETAGATTEGSGEDSAKMGKEEGTHTGPNQGVTPENDTQKVDQPERRNPTTGGDADNGKE